MTYRNPSPRLDSAGHREGRRAGDDYQVSLNFIAVAGEFPEFTVYRRLRATPDDPRPNPDVMAYRLPPSLADEGEWPSYWISIEPTPRYQPFVGRADINPYLTRRVLFWVLASAARHVLKPEQYCPSRSRFTQEVLFVERSHDEGDELLVVQPYFLGATRQFGYLVDFRFQLRKGVPYSRKVQQLSLSLDRNYRRNLNYYIDRSAKVNAFVQERQDVFGALKTPGSAAAIALRDDFVLLPADRLKTKVYVFAGNRESKSRFTGLRDYGPLKPLECKLHLLFVFREQDRQAARMLALNLRGSTARGKYSFPGFKALFKCDLEIDGNPVILSDLTPLSIETALKRAKQENLVQGSLVPVLVLPERDDSYLVQKSLFTHAAFPTQVCTLRILGDEDSLKWAVANVALQIFCKAGGYPWKVRPSADRSLIIGISQSHKLHEVNGERSVEKYFAFSVMTDNSGLFQKIQVLGETRGVTSTT